jgi:hypothetical protein
MPICIGRLAINLDLRVVTVDDRPVHLTMEEFSPRPRAAQPEPGRGRNSRYADR